MLDSRLLFFMRMVGVRVYAYHGVVEKPAHPTGRFFTPLSDFREQLEKLRAVRVMTIEELYHGLQQGKLPRRRAAVLTFDDGMANNLVAAEVLAARKLPWALFVSSGAIDRQEPIWPLLLRLLLQDERVKRLQGLGRWWELGTPQARRQCGRQLVRRLSRMSAEARRASVSQIREQFPAGAADELLARFPSLQVLTWQQIDELARGGVEIGSHGVQHECLHARQSVDTVHAELRHSKARIEERLARPCRYLAYPNGDYHGALLREVREAGYHLAFSTQPWTVTTRSNPLLLPRLPAPRPLR